MSWVEDVLAAHEGSERGAYPGPFVVKCYCGKDTGVRTFPGDAWDAHRAHVADALRAAMREQREAIEDAVVAYENDMGSLDDTSVAGYADAVLDALTGGAS